MRQFIMINRLKQCWCGLRGHCYLLQVEPLKLSLRCGICEKQSAGWRLT